MVTSADLGGILPNQVLVAAGWKPRFLTAPDRLAEATQLYHEMGLEVRTETLLPSELGDKCRSCASAACTSYVMIYTREMPNL